MLSSELKPIADRYLKRMYSEEKIRSIMDNVTELNEYDTKMINTMYKMKKTYKDINARKSKSITLTKYEAQSIDTVVIKKPEPSAPTPLQKGIVILCCKAIKMDGNICNSKIKGNSEFCGRHSKKNKLKKSDLNDK